MKLYHCLSILCVSMVASACKPAECEQASAPAEELRAALSGGSASEAAAAAQQLIPIIKDSDVPEFGYLTYGAEQIVKLTPEYTSKDVPMERRESLTRDWQSAQETYISGYKDFRNVCN